MINADKPHLSNEEAQKSRQIRERHGPTATLILFLCGNFGSGYLRYAVRDRIDWIWEHRPDDLVRLGL